MGTKNSVQFALGDLLFGQQSGKTDPLTLLTMTEFQPARCTVPNQHWGLGGCLYGASFPHKHVIKPAEDQSADGAINKGI
jgi:hypothetical protein